MQKKVKVKILENSPFLVSLEQCDVIGRGMFSVVVRAFNKNNLQQKLVAKIINAKDSETAATIKSEVNILKTVPSHPNLVNCQKIQISSQNNFYLIMEYCNSGNLQRYMQSHKYLLAEEDIQDFLVQFCAGYRVLMQAGVIHRDIKPENIMLNDGTFKIADFGLAKFLKPEEVCINTNLSSKGTPLYMPPELYFDKQGSSKVDVFSLGIVLYRMAFRGIHPFHDESKRFRSIKQYASYMQACPLRFPKRHTRPAQLVDLISRMLEKDKDRRIGWNEIFEHPFINRPKKKLSEERLCPSSEFRRKLEIVNASIVRVQSSDQKDKVFEQKKQDIKEENKQEELPPKIELEEEETNIIINPILTSKTSKIHQRLLNSKKIYTLIEYTTKKINKLPSLQDYPASLKSLLDKICVAGLQYAIFLVDELQTLSGNWQQIPPQQIKTLEQIFNSDRLVLSSQLHRLSNKGRFIPRQYQELLHYLFTDYANFKPAIRKQLATCMVFLLEVYDFINRFERDGYDSLEAHILNVEAMEDVEKGLAVELRKRGLWMGSQQDM